MNPYFTPLLIYRELMNTNVKATLERREKFKGLTYQEYKEVILIEHQRITIERREKFRGFLLELNKLIRFNKDIKQVYDLIILVVDSYCEQYNRHYKFDDLTYDIIFKIIKNIKTDKNTIELFKKILIKPSNVLLNADCL